MLKVIHRSWRHVTVSQCSKHARAFCEINSFNLISVWFFLVHKFLWILYWNWNYLYVLNGCKFHQLNLNGVGKSSHTVHSSIICSYLPPSIVHCTLPYRDPQYWDAHFELAWESFNNVRAFIRGRWPQRPMSYISIVFHPIWYPKRFLNIHVRSRLRNLSPGRTKMRHKDNST